MRQPGELTLQHPARPDGHAPPGRPARLEDRLRVAAGGGDGHVIGIERVHRSRPEAASRPASCGTTRVTISLTVRPKRTSRSRSSSRSRPRPARLSAPASVRGSHERGLPPRPLAAAPHARSRGPTRRPRTPRPVAIAAAAGTGRRELGPRPEGVLRRDGRRAPSATRSTARAATSARTCRTSSTAITHSVLRDIAEPSFAINPDYIAYRRHAEGRPRADRRRPHRRRQAARRRREGQGDGGRAGPTSRRCSPSPISVMPEGLPKLLGPEQTARPADVPAHRAAAHAATTPGEQPPPPRTRAEVRAVLAGAPDPPEKTRPIRVVLVAGREGPRPRRARLPGVAEGVGGAARGRGQHRRRRPRWEWPAAEQFEDGGRAGLLPAGRLGRRSGPRDIDAFLERGGGLVYIH